MKVLPMGLVALIVLVPAIMAEVVVFQEYKTETALLGDALAIHKRLVIKNVGTAPIIPGELHFKLYEQKGNQQVPVDVVELHALDRYKKELTTRQIKTNDEVDLVVSVWEPLLPGFFHPIDVSYTLAFEPKGIFFYQLKIPSEETTIPIVSASQSVTVPAQYHVTYAPEAEIVKTDEGTVVSWTNAKKMELEYSILPLPTFSFRMVNLFWILVIVLLVAPIVWLQVRKRLRREPTYVPV